VRQLGRFGEGVACIPCGSVRDNFSLVGFAVV
jgi:transcriptional antiterminator RfaH